MIRIFRKKPELNLTMFFRKFMLFHGLAQLYELKHLRTSFFSPS